MSRDDLLSTAEAAEFLGKSVPTIRQWAEDGKIPTARKLDGLRGPRLFRRADLEKFQATQAKSAS